MTASPFIGKDPHQLFSTLMLLRSRIEGVKRECSRSNGIYCCPKCGANGAAHHRQDVFTEQERVEGGFHCAVCGEVIDRRILKNWIWSERIIKLEMGLRPRKEERMEEETVTEKKCPLCWHQKPLSAFKQKPDGSYTKCCIACLDGRKAKFTPMSRSTGNPADLQQDFGHLYAEIKKTGEREGAQAVAQDIIDFLTKKYLGT